MTVSADQALEARAGTEVDLDGLGLAVGVGSEPVDLRAGGTLGQVIPAVADDAGDCEALGVHGAALAVAVHGVVYGAGIAPLEDCGVDDALLHKLLVGHLAEGVAAVLDEDDHLVDVGAVAHVLGLLYLLGGGADEALGAVDVELGVGGDDLGGLDVLEGGYLGAAGILRAVFVLEGLEIVDAELRQVLEMVAQLGLFLLDGAYLVGDGLDVELGYLADRLLD